MQHLAQDNHEINMSDAPPRLHVPFSSYIHFAFGSSPSPPSSSIDKNQTTTKFLRPSPIMAQNPELRYNLPYQLAKVSTALTFGGSVSVLSGLTLTATIIGLTAMTPLLVIFSPVLVTAGVVMVLLATGLISSAVFAAMATFVFYWLHSYLAGKDPVGADMLEQVAAKLVSGASSIKDRVHNMMLIKSSINNHCIR